MPVTSDARQLNKAIVREFFTSMSAGDFARASQLICADGSWSVPRRRLVNRLDEQLRLIEGEKVTFGLGDLTAEENRVSALADGDMLRPDGRAARKTFHFLIRIDGGRISEVIMYDDHGFADRPEA